MKFYFTLAITLILTIQSYAQGNAVISGRVIELSTKNPIPYANILITNDSDATVTGSITGENGRFSIKGLTEGDYKVKISFIGYKEKEIPVLVGSLNNAFDLGKIELKESSENLSEVVITAKKDIVSSSLDKKSFNIENNISQAGGSAMDAMRNLPGVTVDTEGKILLRGSDKVTVLIDGKQSSLTGFGNQKGLDNIPASNIERIEIINNPSAKYDSRGLAGIVNIIYKKENKNGFNGNVGLNFGVGELNIRKANLPNIMDKYAFTPKINPSFNLNYHSKNVNLFLQTDGIVRKRVNSNEFITRIYSNGNPNIRSQFLENRTQELYNIKAGVDWFIDDTNKLTLYSLFQDEYHIDRGDVPYDFILDGSRKRLWSWAEDENTRFINYVANFAHNFKQAGHTLDVGLLYTKGGEDELFPFTDTSDTGNSTDETHLLVDEIVTGLNVDYVKPLRSGRIELGSKVEIRKIPISYKINPGTNSVLDPNLGEWSEYNQDVYALYANLIHEGEKLDIEGGFRVEQTTINYDIDPANIYYSKNDAYNYFKFFPNVRLTLKADKNNKISAFYNRRIDRPGEFELRPFPKYDDPEILKTGNPYLRPQFTQTFELAYKTKWREGSVYLAGFYRSIEDIFERIFTNDDTTSGTIINSIPQNLGKGSNLGFEITLEQTVTNNWDINGSFNWYTNKINAFSGTSIYPSPQPFYFDESKSNTWNFKLNNNVTLPYKIDFQLSTVYYAPNIIPQGKVKERYSVDFGLKKNVLKDKGEIKLSATDLLNTFGIKKSIIGDGFNLTSTNYYETQVITLGVKYKF
ncbi:TonB-dependent receptor [Seonamhaeicola sp. S2-3]|uniref:TonB-dependent receptor domain-containing protein n=1 Tax=Seonamhaeicola sp. S2-3 TaxID=1936081 RepID=UPI000972AC62|nr:outer membrane beta-barrel family protein [Seonamhaeicola sp. S2-3]APY10435.1 TonB-dependent receptor [Seonamhaeicola sp. S2-3]